MKQDPEGSRPGGITVGSNEVTAGGSIEVVVADGSSTIEVLTSGVLGAQEFPVPPNGVVNVPVPSVSPGTTIVISNGTVTGEQVEVIVIPRIDR